MDRPEGVLVKEMLMGAETCEVAIDRTPAMYDLLWDSANKVPRDLWILVYDDPVAGDLMYPPMQLFGLPGGKEGLTLTGVGVLHALGSKGIGPTEPDHEYLSGADKLGNPIFALDPVDLYWRRASEGSGWVVTHGLATLIATLEGDDVFESEERFPASPGQEFELTAYTLAGIGCFRVRALYEGRFDPPNLFPTIAAGAWGAQTTNNPTATADAFEAIADSSIAINRSDMALRAQTPFPILQLVLNPVFDQGADGEDNWFTGGDARWVADGSGAPDMPTSIHYEGSGFITPDVVITATSNVITSATANWTSPSAVGMLVEGPDIPPYTYVVSVSAPGTLQMSNTATASHLAGDQAVAFRPQTVSRTYFTTDAADAGTTLSQYGVTKGEQWSIYGQAKKTDNANGTATINFAKVKTATDDHLAGVFWEQAATITTGGQLVLSTAPEPSVRIITKTTTIEEETTGLGVFVELQGNTDGRWWFSNFLLQRVIGNIDSIVGDAVTLTPERTYRFSIPCKGSALLVKEATARLRVVLTGAGRPDIVLRSADQAHTNGEVVDIVLDVRPPSGYDLATSHLEIQDVFNDYFYFGEMTVTDTDKSTAVFDTVVTNPGGVSPVVTSTAPAGAVEVRWQLVADNGASGAFHGASLIRTTATPATGADIVADVLTDPTTGDPLAIAAGTITAPNPIPYDVRFIRTTRRDQLDRLAAVIANPVLEYKVNAALPATIDVGTPDVVFTTHPLVEAILPSDKEVEELTNPDSDTSDRPTEIVLVGNERQTVSGRPFLITATAQVPGPVRYDINNRPVRRTKTVTAGTVDHVGYAQAYAAELAARAAEPAVLVRVTLSGKNATGDVPPGDTTHVYRPEAGLTAYPDNGTTIAGRPAFPRAVRSLVRERALGPSHRIVMLRPDGTTFPLTGVRWSKSDTVQLTLGDFLPDWIVDPEGGAEGKQFLADHVTRPR